MALLYRAIWEDSRPGLEDLGEAAFRAWLDRKRYVTDPRQREARGETDGTRWSVTCRRAAAEGTRALQARLVEHRDRETWTTTFTVLATPHERTGWFWVDIDRVSVDPFERHPFAAPRLVIDLIAEAAASKGYPRSGGVGLVTRAEAIEATVLAKVVRNPNRRLPVVAFAHDDAGGASVTLHRAQEAIARLAGIAAVYVVPPDELTVFNARMGSDMGMELGSARVYLPFTGAGGSSAARHRVLPRGRIDRHAGAAGAAIVAMLTPSATATPPPAAYEAVARNLTLSSGRTTEVHALLDAAFEESTELRVTIDELRHSTTEMEERLLDLQIETEGLQTEINRQSAYIAVLRSNQGTAEPGELELPVEVESISEAIEAAARLDGVVVHPDAPRDIEKLDQHLEGPKWAKATWSGLRALDEYGRRGAEEGKGFWEWCRTGDAAWRWPATPKKLALSESESVMSNRKLLACRDLPVDPAVCGSGSVIMQAHLKVAEGGGLLAPRVYFLDDTGGATGKVHIGFIGPHEHMPNTRTN